MFKELKSLIKMLRTTGSSIFCSSYEHLYKDFLFYYLLYFSFSSALNLILQ